MIAPEFQFEQIPASNGLDSIDIYWRNVGECKGHVTITCWGQAWTCYFNAPGCAIREFFGRADVDYLVTTLGITPLLKQRKRDHEYLAKIIRAIKAHLLSEVPSE